MTRNNSSNAARDVADNRRLPAQNRSASPSRVHADRDTASRSRSNSQATAVVSGQSQSRRNPPRGRRGNGMREPVALGPNVVNFATRSASPHVAISPENVSPAIVDHQMKIGAGAPEAFLNLDGQQAQGDEDCSMDVVEPPNHQQAQSTTQLQTTPEAADIGPNNIGPQTTALSAAVAVDGGG